MAYSVVIAYKNRADAERDATRLIAYGCEVCAIGADGREALDLVRKHRPDALVMDAFLPYFNCDEIARFLAEEGLNTVVRIAVSDEANPRMADRFLASGGDLFLIRPLDYVHCLRRIEQFHKMRQRQALYALDDSTKRSAVRRLQIRLNMPISIVGFWYLQEAVLLAMNDPKALCQMTNVFYPCIASHFKTNGKNVERCIRNAVEKTFEEGDLAMLQRYFSHFLNNKNGKPTNKDFIGYLAELAQDQLFELTRWSSLL